VTKNISYRKNIFFLQQDFFLITRKNSCAKKKSILAVRKKNVLSLCIRKHFCELPRGEISFIKLGDRRAERQ